MQVVHPLSPIIDSQARRLILGSFPSQKTRQRHFYYAHPQNRFWPVMSRLLDQPLAAARPQEARAALLQRGIALWDVLLACQIEGSSDASIRQAQPQNLDDLFDLAPIERVFLNGRLAERLYWRYNPARPGVEVLALPSTSPANASWSLERLIEAWQIVVAH